MCACLGFIAIGVIVHRLKAVIRIVWNEARRRKHIPIVDRCSQQLSRYVTSGMLKSSCY